MVEQVRVLIVDEKGKVVDGDQLMAVIGESWHRKGRLAAGGVVATVMSNLGLERYLKDKGLTLERTKVGDRYVLERMKEGGFNVGGEQSGHMILTDFGTTGDGTVAALRVLASVVRSGKPASELLHVFDPVPQLLKNVRYSGGKPLEAESVKSVIAQAEKALEGTGRLVIPLTGTEPVIRVMADGDDAGAGRSRRRGRRAARADRDGRPAGDGSRRRGGPDSQVGRTRAERARSHRGPVTLRDRAGRN